MRSLYSYFYRSSLGILATIAALSAPTLSCARPLWDETTLSLGMTQHDFRDYRLDSSHSPDFIAQHYQASSPNVQGKWIREFVPCWHTQWSLDLHYDLGLESETAFSNGQYVFDAHSWNAELKSLIIYEPKSKFIKLGLGAGLGNYALVTNIDETSQYFHHINLMGPILHIGKDYEAFGLKGSFAAEASRLDFYIFTGMRYSLENTFWFKQTPEVDQGIRVAYLYWNIDQGLLGRYQWMRDFHGMSWTLEFKFK